MIRKASDGSNYFWCIVFVLFAVLGIFSCEKKEIIFEGPYHVRFTQLDTSVRESYVKPIQISVHNAGPQLSTPITITYAVGGNAREGIDYQILGTKGKVTIPANQSFSYIQLQLINNANNILESQDVQFTILDVEPNNLKIGLGEGEIGKTMHFTIVDECFLSGTYTGANTNLSPSPIKGDITITSTNCEEYTVSNWNIDTQVKVSDNDPQSVFSFNAIKPDFIFVDNGDNTLTIPQQVESELTAPRDTIQGSGSYNPVNGQLTFNIKYKYRYRTQELDTVVSVIQTLTYTPQR